MILATNANIFVQGWRVISSAIDSAVYGILVHIANLFVTISRVNIFSDETITTFSSRIYFIMGTIMFFKMAISVINYIVDPDKLTDGKSGFASIIKNVVVALVLVVTVPIVFRYAGYLQQVVLQDDTIGRLITGRTGGTQNNIGDTIATNILSGFIHVDPDVIGEECDTLGYSAACEQKIRDAKYTSVADAYHYIDLDNRANASNSIASKYGYHYLLEMGATSDVVKSSSGGKQYVVEYLTPVALLAGGFAAYIFLLFCIDIALRTVKLGFLQLIAPIPIATYIDPKGQEMFKKWVKVSVGTYVDVFVRLAAIDFGIFIITEFLKDFNDHQICTVSFVNGVFQASNQNCTKPGMFAQIFLILGTLMFIKELPKMVEDITGIKMSGKFTLGFRNKLGEVPLIGGAAAAGLTMAGNAALSAPGAILGKAFKNTQFGDNMMMRASRRWNRSLEESHARMQASGWAGGQFKGDTVHSMRAKEKEEMIKKRREASMAVNQQRSAYSMGKASAPIDDIYTEGGVQYVDDKGNWTNKNGYEAQYRNAGFESDQYIESAMTVDQNKFKLQQASKALEKAQIEAQRAAMGAPGAKSVDDAAKDVATAREAYEKAQKSLASSEENLKVVGERHAGDAKLAQARKVAKGVKTEANDGYTHTDRHAY